MEIAEAHERDIDAILELWGDLAAFHARLDPAFAPSAGWRAAYQGYLSTLLDREDARVLVASEKGKVVGYAVGRITMLPPFFAERRRGFIQDVYTHEGYRRQGIARRLVQELLQWLREEEIATVELTVASTNVDAIRLWESLGFQAYMQHFKRTL